MILGTSFWHDTENKTKNGIDKLGLMLKIMQVLEGKDHEKQCNNLVKFIEVEIGREMKGQEKIDLTQGIIDYIKTDPATNERSDAMKYLFNAEFFDECKC